jgi:nucleoside-diphosphate-sugar epimerase
MKRILVTGGSGFIGSGLVKRLVQDGYPVRVFDNNSRGSKTKLGTFLKEIDFVEGDIRNFDEVDKACKGVDILFHLAFINGTKYFYEIPEKVLEVGVKGAIHTLDAAVKHHVEKYILASSSEVYQEPTVIPTPETERAIIPDVTNPRYSYSGAKLISELLAINYSRKGLFETMIFRPHNIYGPDMGCEHVIPEFILRMKELSEGFTKSSINFPIQGSGKETRAFCFIDDFIDGLMLVFQSGKSGEIYHIGNDTEEVEIVQLAKELARLMNISPNIIHTELQKGGTGRRCPCIDKMRKLGFEPKVSLTEGLARTIDWYVNCNGKES